MSSADISKDGMLEGPAFALYESLLSTFPKIKLIASGGLSNISELPVWLIWVVMALSLEKRFMKKNKFEILESYIIENS